MNDDRKSISVREDTHRAFKRKCRRAGVPIGPTMDRIITDYLDAVHASQLSGGGQ